MSYRIDSRQGWASVVRRLEVADAAALERCRRIVATRAMNVLVCLEYDSLDKVGDPLTRGAGRSAMLQSLAEVADDQYLRAQEAEDGDVSEEVSRQFATARALAALVFIVDAKRPEDVIEGVYELSVASSGEEEALRRDIRTALEPLN